MIVKTEDSDFLRDQSNYALINSNINAYNLYKQQRKQQYDFSNVQQEIDMLKTDISDIKNMLGILIQRENNGSTNK
jgi:hypothetical protein